MIDNAPTFLVEKPEAPSRDRVLSEKEIVAFWRAAYEVGCPGGLILMLLLVSAQRRNEVTNMRWSEVDFEARTWTIPKSRTKSRRQHIVHLSPLAMAILQSLPRLCQWTFTYDGARPYRGHSTLKKTMDRTIAENGCGTLPHWTFHDLRRTCSTHMGNLGVEPHIVARVLNHTDPSITAVYNRSDYVPGTVVALDRWGDHLSNLVADFIPAPASRVDGIAGGNTPQQEALASSGRTVVSNRPCPKGHRLRYASSRNGPGSLGRCAICSRAATLEWAATKRSKEREAAD
jgi:hypothetical protein